MGHTSDSHGPAGSQGVFTGIVIVYGVGFWSLLAGQSPAWDPNVTGAAP